MRTLSLRSSAPGPTRSCRKLTESTRKVSSSASVIPPLSPASLAPITALWTIVQCRRPGYGCRSAYPLSRGLPWSSPSPPPAYGQGFDYYLPLELLQKDRQERNQNLLKRWDGEKWKVYMAFIHWVPPSLRSGGSHLWTQRLLCEAGGPVCTEQYRRLWVG